MGLSAKQTGLWTERDTAEPAPARFGHDSVYRRPQLEWGVYEASVRAMPYTAVSKIKTDMTP